MSTTPILKSTGTSLEDLDNSVDRYRELTYPAPALVPADTFDIEDRASTILELATRLAAIRDHAARLLEAEGPAGDLARKIEAIAMPQFTPAADVVAALHAGDELVSEKKVYGAIGLRHVSHCSVDHEKEAFVISSYIVDTYDGSAHPLLADEDADDAAIRVSLRGETRKAA